jgi:putative ABC transport system permease protein
VILLARAILFLLLPADARRSVLAELDTEYARVLVPSRGRLRAALWYWRQVAGSAGPALAMRGRRIGRILSDAAQDARFGIRWLMRHPGFTAAAVLTLALGIGANTVIFSVVDRVLIRPLPYRDPSRLVRIWSANPRGIPRNGISPADFFDWREQARGVDGLAAFAGVDATLTSAGDPVQLTAAAVTANLADTLGVGPILGRWFLDEETRGSGQPVVILSEALWRERFGGATDIVGRTVTLDFKPRTVVGVMSRAFEFPSSDDRIWLPLPDGWRTQTRAARFLGAVGRLAPGVTLDAARDSLRGVARRIEDAYPDNRGWSVTMVPLGDAVVGDVRTPLLVLFASVASILLIACANVAGLMLARGASRSRELAVRAAVGATGSRLLRQQLVESALLALMGCGAALVAASWCLQLVHVATVTGVPFLDRVTIDLRVLAAAAVLSLLAAVMTGLLPAWHASRHRGTEALGSGSRTTGTSVRVRKAIVFAQIAMATAMVAGGLLLLRSLARLTAVPSGFQADRTLLADVSLPTARYDRFARAPFFDRALDRIRAIPGVQAAGAGGPLPLSGQDGLLRFGLQVEGPPQPRGASDRAYVRWATPGYFAAMGIRQDAGRPFTAADTADSTPVAIVDEELARRFFGSADPIGRRVKASMEKTWRQVVGVVGSVRQTALDRAAEPHIYLPQAQLANAGLTLVVRSSGDQAALVRDVREAVRSIDPDLPLSNMRSLADLVAGSTASRRLSTRMLALFAAVAVMLTLVGVYGVVSQIVAQSTRELGIRIALGATAGDVVMLTLRNAVTMAMAGVAAGSIVAWLAAPALGGMVYGIAPRDPVTLAAAAGLLTTAAAIAAYLPARRILRLDVLASLRVE